MGKATDELRRDVEDWDGKSVEVIGIVYEAHEDRPDFVDDLLAMIREPSLQTGATWLLKKRIETVGRLGDASEAAIWGSLDSLETWPAKLHVLQCVPHLPIPRAALDDVGAFVRANLDAEKTFVRAWAYGALHELARLDPARFEDEARRRFVRAKRSESASVKARLRRLGVPGFGPE